MTANQVGFQPRTTPAERRADIDIRRQLAALGAVDLSAIEARLTALEAADVALAAADTALDGRLDTIEGTIAADPWVNETGDTMTGDLTLPGPGTLPAHATTRQGATDLATFIAAEYVNGITVPLSFATNWSDWLGGYGPCQATKLGNFVWLTGLAKVSVSFSSGVIGSLPTGYRPGGTEMYVVNTSAAGGVCRLDVLANGNVALSTQIAVTVPANGYVGLKAFWKV